MMTSAGASALKLKPVAGTTERYSQLVQLEKRKKGRRCTNSTDSLMRGAGTYIRESLFDKVSDQKIGQNPLL